MSCTDCNNESIIIVSEPKEACESPCTQSSVCNETIDAACVLYHEDNSKPTQLTNLNLPNGTSVEKILEKIDTFLSGDITGENGTSGTSGNSGTSGLDGGSGTSGTSGVDGDGGESDVYIPTLDNGSNVDSVNAFQCQWLQVGSVVTVSGKIGTTATTTGQSSINISLPVASAIGNDYECAGTAVSLSAGFITGVIIGDADNAAAKLVWSAPFSFLDHDFFFTFTYLVTAP